MKALTYIIISSICSIQASGQNYDRLPHCGTDTIDIRYDERRWVGRRDTAGAHYDALRGRNYIPTPVRYRAFECTQVTKLGVRFDIGFNTFIYDKRTETLLGRHNGGMVGFALMQGDFTLGAKFVLSTVYPTPGIMYRGEPFRADARLNPIKINYDLSYSMHIKYNFCIEPYLALTSHSFRVLIMKDTLPDEEYSVAKVKGLTAGVMLNKYFRIKNFEYFALFARYGYGLTNFRRIDNNLGFGYHDISFGIAYKAFSRKRFYKRIDGSEAKN